MSQVYSTEPQTSGRVILETTHGPLEIQLWCRECPATTKFFLQLCLDGFYDHMVFHRIVSSFLVQTGAIRHGKKDGSTEKDMDVYRRKHNADQALERKSYELNSRIRFNHRGQVAMALEVGDDNDMAMMQPQFFITLDEAPYLDGKHICFGTVSGPTIFNALRIGQTDVDEETNQPRELGEAPRIQGVKIMENPIHTDIVPCQTVPWRMQAKEDAPKKKKKRKGVKNVNVLSFGDEFEEEAGTTGGGIKSSHDLIQSKIISKGVDKELKQPDKDGKDKQVRKTKNDKNQDEPKMEADKVIPTTEEGKKTEEDSERINTRPAAGSIQAEMPKYTRREPEPTKKIVPESSSKPKKEKSKAPKISLVEARRAKYAKKGQKDKRKREVDTMAKFMAFQSKIVRNVSDRNGKDEVGDDAIAARMSRRAEEADDVTVEEKEDVAVSYHGQVLENDDDVESDWLKTRFKCRKHMDHDAKLGGDGRNAMDYEVVDEKDPKSSKKKRHNHHHQQPHRHQHSSKK